MKTLSHAFAFQVLLLQAADEGRGPAQARASWSCSRAGAQPTGGGSR